MKMGTLANEYRLHLLNAACLQKGTPSCTKQGILQEEGELPSIQQLLPWDYSDLGEWQTRIGRTLSKKEWLQFLLYRKTHYKEVSLGISRP